MKLVRALYKSKLGTHKGHAKHVSDGMGKPLCKDKPRFDNPKHLSNWIPEKGEPTCTDCINLIKKSARNKK